jgi:alkylation response protein AidB-like acyl-CoA dehydrogenase
MDRTLFTDDHELFRESVRAFVAQTVRPNHERWRHERAIDRSFWLEAGRHDFLGIAMPAEQGGQDLDDFRFNMVLIEELAAAGLALSSAVGIHVDVVAPYLIELATAEQRERWMPGFCTGELITALAMTEPGGGSDLAALRTRAVRNGGDWLLSGSKTFITNGMSADLVIVPARTGPGRREITLFGVASGTPGFTRGRKLDKVGQHEADTAELFFEDVRLTDAEVLGPLGEGFAAMMSHLAQERLHVAVENLAHATAQFATTLQYAKERQAFGAPIGSFQHNRFRLAEMSTRLDVTQAFVDHCVVAHVAGRLSPVDAAKAKWWSADVQNEVIDGCVQLFGGYGYMEEYEVARAWTDARITRIWAGTNEIMKEIIGRDLGLVAPR